ncbi:hypothetical protein [Streptomyces liangshanensis]|uniref:hypothetical protein n=1 Tax=Streptomyces liangshanensis TaxID=2717324 RepID=UPI0036DF894D
MARRHTSGFEIVGMDADPTPGQPEEIDRLETRYRQIGDEADVARQFTQKGGGLESGRGAAIDSLKGVIGDLPDKLGKTVDSYHSAADAYRGYSPQLVQAQDMLDQAMDKATAVAGAATQTVAPLPADATDEQKAQNKQQSDSKDAADQELTAAKRMAQDAKDLRDSAARECERVLDVAVSQAIPERNIFQKIADAFKDFPFIQILLGALIAITSIFFPVAGVLLGAALFAVNQIVAIGSGQFRLGDFLVGLLSFIPGGALLKGAGAIATKIVPGLLKAGAGVIKSATGSITKIADTLTTSKIGGGLLAGAGVKEAGKVVGDVTVKFGVESGKEAAVEKLNGDPLDAKAIFGGAAAVAGVGGLIKGAGIIRKGRGGGTDAGAAASPATAPAVAGAGAAGAKSLGDRLRDAKDGALEQAGELVPEAAASAVKVGVAVSEGTSLGDAVTSEASNFIPTAPGTAHGTVHDKISGLIPTKTSKPEGSTASAAHAGDAVAHTGDAASTPTVTPAPTGDSSSSTSPDSAPNPEPSSPGPGPEPQDIPLPPSPPGSPTEPTGSPFGPPQSPTDSDGGFTTAPSSPVEEGGFTTAPSSPVEETASVTPPTPPGTPTPPTEPTPPATGTPPAP